MLRWLPSSHALWTEPGQNATCSGWQASLGHRRLQTCSFHFAPLLLLASEMPGLRKNTEFHRTTRLDANIGLVVMREETYCPCSTKKKNTKSVSGYANSHRLTSRQLVLNQPLGLKENINQASSPLQMSRTCEILASKILSRQRHRHF